MENLFLKKEQSVTFTGRRFIPYGKLSMLKVALKSIILELYAKGYNNYYCGMAMGFDLLSAEAVLSLKAEYKELRLIAVVPYRNQDERFSFADKKRYQSILSRADETIILREDYCQGCLLRRNDYMLAHSNQVIAYFDG
ncbi:MAG: SLOG family protein, partial [Parabacteroides sp.]